MTTIVESTINTRKEVRNGFSRMYWASLLKFLINFCLT